MYLTIWGLGDLRFENYEKLSVTTDMVVLTVDKKIPENNRLSAEIGLQVLLVKRDINPFNGEWSLPGGFVNPGDRLVDCVQNKLMHKTGLKNVYNEQLYTFGDVLDRDPRGRVISVAYMALSPKSKIQLDNSIAEKESSWFWVRALRDDTGNIISILLENSQDKSEIICNLAFDHMEMLKCALTRIQNKVMYTDIAFEMMEEIFTIKELQTVYEEILGKQIQGFRRIIDQKLDETDLWTDGKAHRPARLYKKK